VALFFYPKSSNIVYDSAFEDFFRNEGVFEFEIIYMGGKIKS